MVLLGIGLAVGLIARESRRVGGAVGVPACRTDFQSVRVGRSGRIENPSYKPELQQCVRLFNGRNLDGWQHLGGGKCSVRDGLLILEHDEEHKPGYLLSSVSARDFSVRLRCKVIEGDSGFLFRSRRDPRTPTELIGPQIQLNIEPDRGLGGIFELQGRGWVRKTPASSNAELLRSLDWIDCESTVRGNAIRVVVNGRVTADFRDDKNKNEFRDSGSFALQIHGGSRCKVIFQEIDVTILEER